MSFMNRFKAAPAPASNGTKRQFNQKTFNNASIKLKNALSTIANQHVLKYANDIRKNAKAQANAAHAAAVAVENPTQVNTSRAITAANNAAKTNNNMIRSGQAAVNAVNAVTIVIKNIQNVNKPLNINAIRAKNAYTKGSNNNRKRINNAINARKPPNANNHPNANSNGNRKN